jgi:hypothetical protein
MYHGFYQALGAHTQLCIDKCLYNVSWKFTFFLHCNEATNPLKY